MKKLVLVFIVLVVAWRMLQSRPTAPPTAEWSRSSATDSPARWRPGPHGPKVRIWHNGQRGRSVVVVRESSEPPVPVTRPEAVSIAPAPPTPPAPPAAEQAPAAPEPQVVADKAAGHDEVEGTPSWFAELENWENLIGPAQEPLRTVKSKQLATVERAQADARLRLDRAVSNWLSPDVPRTWKAPRRAVEALVLDKHVERIDHDYGPLYVAGYRVDSSPERRARLLAAYHHEIVSQRLFVLGGGLGFVLVCLGAVAGYIHADEATKGYYTNRLRLLAAAGVGAAGLALYQALA